MNDARKVTSILRYAELTFRQQHRSLTEAEKEERQKILTELAMTHEQVMELAAKNVIDELE